MDLLSNLNTKNWENNDPNAIDGKMFLYNVSGQLCSAFGNLENLSSAQFNQFRLLEQSLPRLRLPVWVPQYILHLTQLFSRHRAHCN